VVEDASELCGGEARARHVLPLVGREALDLVGILHEELELVATVESLGGGGVALPVGEDLPHPAERGGDGAVRLLERGRHRHILLRLLLLGEPRLLRLRGGEGWG